MKLDMNLTSLGETSSAADWVEQSRLKEVEKNKKLAEDRRKQYEEELRQAEGDDDDLPIAKRPKTAVYGSSDLKGMKVMHSSRAFDEQEGEIILTLADTSVVATDEYGKVVGMNENEDDVLVNVNLAEDDRRADREKRQKKLRAGVYSGYDDDEFADGVAPGAKRSILGHYDKEQSAGPRMTLGEQGVASLTSSAAAAGPSGIGKQQEFVSLKMALKPAPAFLTMAEVKRRKTGKMQVRTRKQEAEEEEGAFDLANLPAEGSVGDAAGADAVAAVKPESGAGTAEAVVDKVDISKSVLEKPRIVQRSWVGEVEEDEDLVAALAKARALAVRKNLLLKEQENQDSGAKATLQLMQHAGAEMEDQDPDSVVVDTEGRRADGAVVFNSTVEFSTRLQATLSEKARLRAENVARDTETAAMNEAAEVASAASSSKQADGDGSMDVPDDEDLSDESVADPDDVSDDEDEQMGFLHDLPRASGGMGAALELLRGTGDLRHKEALAGRAKDDRVVDPSQTDGVKLEYRDEFGRKLTQKEAFRQLSYRFHGYGPGKKKKEKRLQAMVQQQAATSRNKVLEGSAGTMKSLTTAQEATGKAHIVVQGGVHGTAPQIAALAARMAQEKVDKLKRKKNKEAKEKNA